jgi:drug/metabolite transporter (DMT)-like permease
MGLAEVLFAVLIAWLVLGERMTALQVIGGIVVLLGLALARRGESSVPAEPQTKPQKEPQQERIPASALNLSESSS